jgi:quercetin dioxygenase-like cupin family protein
MRHVTTSPVSTATRSALLVVALALAPGVAPILAQPPTPSAPPADPDPGVRLNRLIDRDEIRVSRIDLQPGAVRSVHAHDDVEYHVWAPVEGTFEITIGPDKPVVARPGQAFFMKRGTRHGFRNAGATPAAVFEIFVKKSIASAASGGETAVPEWLAALTKQ